MLNIEDLDIKLAIEFLKSHGYSWDGKIVNEVNKHTTIAEFYCPKLVIINGEKKGLILYEDCYDTPDCIFYNPTEDGYFVIETSLTNEWTKFLESKNIIKN